MFGLRKVGMPLRNLQGGYRLFGFRVGVYRFSKVFLGGLDFRPSGFMKFKGSFTRIPQGRATRPRKKKAMRTVRSAHPVRWHLFSWGKSAWTRTSGSVERYPAPEAG